MRLSALFDAHAFNFTHAWHFACMHYCTVHWMWHNVKCTLNDHALKVLPYDVQSCASCIMCLWYLVSHHIAPNYFTTCDGHMDMQLNEIALNAAGSHPSDHGLHGWQSWHCSASAVPWGQCPCCRCACKPPFISVFILLLSTVALLLLVSIVLTNQSTACFWAQQSRIQCKKWCVQSSVYRLTMVSCVATGAKHVHNI